MIIANAQTVLTSGEVVYEETSQIDNQGEQKNKRTSLHTITFSDQFLKKRAMLREAVLSTTVCDLVNKKTLFYLTDSENYYYINDEYLPSFLNLGLYEKSTPAIKLLDETQLVNGYDCKKAVFAYNINGNDEIIEVWYSPEYKIDAPGANYAFQQLQGLPVKFTLKMLNPIQMSMGINGHREFNLVSLREVRPDEVAKVENVEKYKFLNDNEKPNLLAMINMHRGSNRPTPENKGEAVKEVFSSDGKSNLTVVRFNPFKLGEKLQNFEAKDVNGVQKTLDSYTGKAMVLNFWFTDCAPCIKEMPYLNSLTEKYKDKDIAFVSMTFNTKEEVKKFLQKNAFKFDNIIDARGSIEKYGISAYPLTVVTDKNKIIQYVKVGEVNSDIEKEINKTMQ